MKILILKDQFQGKFLKFLSELVSFWNVIDISRLIFLMTFIVQEFFGPHEINRNSGVEATLDTLSVVGLLLHLRLFKSFQFILTLI